MQWSLGGDSNTHASGGRPKLASVKRLTLSGHEPTFTIH
jgi:hypothetical protein